MDLYAYMFKADAGIERYIAAHYGKVPRNRGVRFMKAEEPVADPQCDEERVFNKYAGQDVIYIHTRCGNCGRGYDDPDSNYVCCGAKDWEEAHKALFLEHITEEYDCTYCTHYFQAVDDELYREIICDLTCEEEAPYAETV